MFKRKNGQVEMATSAVITLIVGIGVSVLVLIFVGVLGGQTYSITESKINEIGNKTVTDYDVTPLVNTTYSLQHGYVHEGTLTIYNTSNKVGLGNFSIDYTAGTVELKTLKWNNTELTHNFSYGDYSVRNDVKSAIKSGFTSLKQVGDYMPLVVLAIIIMLVLVLVLGLTGGYSGNSRHTAL